MYTFSFTYRPSRGPFRYLIQDICANNYKMAELKLFMTLGDEIDEILNCERFS